MAEDRNENSYRNILKGTSIFGGVQVFQILINLVRGKFVAMFLGAEGMGVASLFTSSFNTLTQTASLGLNLAFVKETAANKENPEGLAAVMRVAGLLLQLTGLLGAFACVILSPLLSVWSFGTDAYAWQYMLLAIAVYLSVTANGNMALLQGLHKVKILSVSSLAGAVAGLMAGVPLYYFFGTKGIVPAIIVLALTAFCCYTLGLRKAVGTPKPKFSFREHGPIARRLLSLGLILLSSTLINTAFTYIINVFIRAYGDMTHVGLFNAANSITLQYAGVVFTAMALDYFPRLTAAASDNTLMAKIVNRQSEIVALMAAPLAILLVATAPLVIRILLTPEFLPVTELMRWLGISILIKAIAYPLGYITFAKNNRRLFFWLEAVACNLLYLGLSLGFYRAFGFMGLGYAAVTEQACCVLLYLGVNYKVYGFRPNRSAMIQTTAAILTGAAGFAASIFLSGALSYIIMGAITVFAGVRAYIILRRLIRQK